MHQDFDPRDLEPAGPAEEASPRRRWLPIGIALVALGGFSGIVWYAYNKGTGGSSDPATAPLVRADQNPVKVKPDQPGGLDVPHQDKLVLNSGEQPKVERILPPPESPLPRPAAPAPQAAAPAPVPAAPAPGAAPAPNAAPRATVTTQATQPAQTTPVRNPPPGQASGGAGQPPAQIAAAPPPPAAGAKPAQPIALPPPPPVAKGALRIQLAAVKTPEAANDEWARIKRANPELANLGMNAVKVDLGEKGTFYRIQAGPIADASEATRLCDGLKAKKQACLLVR